MKRKPARVTATLQEKEGRLYIVARIPDSAGKLHQKWFATGLSAKGNKRRAKQLLDEKLVVLQAEYERCCRRAGWAASDTAQVPFVEVLDRWMERKRIELAPSTIEGYGHILARMRPYFQRLDLTTGEISPAVVEGYVAHLLDAGLSATRSATI